MGRCDTYPGSFRLPLFYGEEEQNLKCPSAITFMTFLLLYWIILRVEYFMLHLRKAVTGVMQLWQNLQTEDSFAGTFTAAFFGFPTFLCERAAQPNQRNEENCVKKYLLLSSANDPTILSYFFPGANTKPLGARA